ncbi:MAG TPA: hypothetical protein VGT06_06960, partial [Candidatus Methylomirabilis sp.]|nr:hypothetical protein [Candidatus Methylomirabilis sp.]
FAGVSGTTLRATTPDVEDNAITNSGLYSNNAAEGFTTTEEEIGSITITTDGGPVAVWGLATLQKVNVENDTFALAIRKDSISGSILGSTNVAIKGSGEDGLLAQTVIGFDSSPAASQTYKLTIVATVGTTASNQLASNRRLIAMNLKK